MNKHTYLLLATRCGCRVRMVEFARWRHRGRSLMPTIALFRKPSLQRCLTWGA